MFSFTDVGIKLDNLTVHIVRPSLLRSKSWDQLIYLAVFGSHDERILARYVVQSVAHKLKIIPSSIQALYHARSTEEIPDNFTVPAINIRGITYDTARGIFSAMTKSNVGTVIFEIAKSELDYTNQTAEEYTTVILGAAVREGFTGPVYLQADHTQLKAVSPGIAQEGEEERLSTHLTKVVKSGFYNLDLDASTLVDLSKKTIRAQQEGNIFWTAKLLKFIQKLENKVKISVGVEIGHIGDRNSTVEDLEVFMKGLQGLTLKHTECVTKISIQTGTSHGGVVDEKGHLVPMSVDFDLLKNITLAGKKYGLGGSVQHGASTLSQEHFSRFPESRTLEIHLATGWQNLIFDHPKFPTILKRKMYHYLLENKPMDSSLTDAQYLYQNRKKGWGIFKQDFWDIDESIRAELRATLSATASTLFKSLAVINTQNISIKYALSPKSRLSIHDFTGL